MPPEVWLWTQNPGGASKAKRAQNWFLILWNRRESRKWEARGTTIVSSACRRVPLPGYSCNGGTVSKPAYEAAVQIRMCSNELQQQIFVVHTRLSLNIISWTSFCKELALRTRNQSVPNKRIEIRECTQLFGATLLFARIGGSRIQVWFGIVEVLRSLLGHIHGVWEKPDTF